ncbi:MAG: PLP-dependent aminotransferase family protein [Candidatus Hinthialibacter antarcticus]|nr:PLP-dependent aminotransferase family protein [Candidatus Hinthialibacter antarcticus]
MNDNNWNNRFSQCGQRTAAPEISWLMAQALETPGLISLAAGFVDQESLPHNVVSSEVGEILNEPVRGRAMLQYGTTQGDDGLRRMLQERLLEEGVVHPNAPIDASHFILGSGSQQILYLLAEALLDEGDIVLMEAPTYFVVLGAMQTRGAQTIGIDIDEGGLVPEKLEQTLQRLESEGALDRVKMLYCMTYAGNPHGVTLREERRPQILNILRKYRERGYPILLLEDAAYRRLNFSTPPPPVKSLDEDNDLVLYTESFSKSLSPGLRLGFGVGPKEIIDKLIHLKGNHDFGSSNVSQTILKRILAVGAFDRHVALLRSVYQKKCDIALDVLMDAMPQGAHLPHPDGGFYIWATLPEEYDTGAKAPIFQAAIQSKVLYVPGALCFSPDRPESARSSTMRISYGQIGEDELREGCERLAGVLAQFASAAR